jgi:hypothetical protein
LKYAGGAPRLRRDSEPARGGCHLVSLRARVPAGGALGAVKTQGAAGRVVTFTRGIYYMAVLAGFISRCFLPMGCHSHSRPGLSDWSRGTRWLSSIEYSLTKPNAQTNEKSEKVPRTVSAGRAGCGVTRVDAHGQQRGGGRAHDVRLDSRDGGGAPCRRSVRHDASDGRLYKLQSVQLTRSLKAPGFNP